MKTSKQLIEERSIYTAKIAELSAKETLTDAEQTELRNALNSESKLTENVETALTLEKRNANDAANAAKVAGAGLGDNGKKEARNFQLGKVISSMVSNSPVSGVEKEMIQDSAAEARSQGIVTKGIYLSENILNSMYEKRTMSAGSSTAGGNTIQTDKVGFFKALYAKRVLEQLGVKYYTGLSHNTDLTGFSAGVVTGWATEVANLAAGDATTASRSMTPHRLGAYVDLSNQLLIQNPQMEAEVLDSFMSSIYVAVEAAVINGTGASGQPLGILGTSGIQDVAIGTNGGAPTLAKILELVQKIQTANADPNMIKFLINPKVEAKLKQTSIDTGSGAMIMSYQNYFTGTPGVIDGRYTAVTSNVPSNLTKGSTSGTCSAILAGDFSKVALAQFGGMDMIIDPFSQAIGGKVRIVANTFWDCAITSPEAMGAILDATTV